MGQKHRPNILPVVLFILAMAVNVFGICFCLNSRQEPRRNFGLIREIVLKLYPMLENAYFSSNIFSSCAAKFSVWEISLISVWLVSLAATPQLLP